MGAVPDDEQDNPALAALAGARAARSDPLRSEQAVLTAVGLAPDDADIRMGAYKFYFYNNRLAEALPHAEAYFALAARALNLPADWRLIEPWPELFGEIEPKPRRILQTLVAMGYCRARVGDIAIGLEMLEKVVALDPDDRFGARRLADLIAHGPDQDDD